MTFVPTKPRGPIAAMYSSPGPVYKLAPLIGFKEHSPSSAFRKSPAYSFGMRTTTDKNDRSPGPCYSLPSRLYHTGPDGIPAYSLSGRPQDLTVHQTPGPGAYSKENSDKAAFQRSPTFTMAGRYNERNSDNTPAPNVYTLPPAIGKTVNKKQMPAYSIVGRSKIGGIAEDLAKTPGPGAYSTDIPSTRPKYTMAGRNMLPGDSTMKPGPGAHDVNTAFHCIHPIRSYSFGIRHSRYLAPIISRRDND